MSNVQDIKTFSPITLNIGGKLRSLSFDLNAFAELENRAGTIEKAMKGLETGSITSIRLILWAGLLHEEAILDAVTGEPTGYNITPFQVGQWVKPNMFSEVTTKVTEAIMKDMPSQENMTQVVNAAVEYTTKKEAVATTVYTAEELKEKEANAAEKKD